MFDILIILYYLRCMKNGDGPRFVPQKKSKMKTSAISPVAVLYAKSLAFDVVADARFASTPAVIRLAFTFWVQSGFTPGTFAALESAIQMFDITDDRVTTQKIFERLCIHEIMQALSGFSISKLGDYEFAPEYDSLNPEHIYSGTANALLVAIVGAQLDPILIAAETLAGRGMDADGRWIGFKAAVNHDYFQNRK